ncbi:MAG: sodium:calcium antiporter [Candidatus Diapherotrites archaeon]|nr:sodium:calcium antiporter [Candidatus Diapherotrites archaeon]
MIFEIFLLLLGAFLLVVGSDWVSEAATFLAKRFHTTNTAVGILLVSAVLSLPELLVAILAIVKGENGIGVGVVLGSIVVNLGLVIGISAMLRPIVFPRHIISRDVVFMVVATIVVSLIVLDDFGITRRNGIVFLLLFVPYIINVVEQERALAKEQRERESEKIEKTLMFFGRLADGASSIKDPKLIFCAGILLLLAGAELFTSGLSGIAVAFALPKLLVGVTLGAIGPSLPNLAAAIQAVRKKYDDLAVSETIGSNIFTLLVTLGIISLIAPVSIDSETAFVTAPAILVVSLAFFAFSLRGRISRKAGLILLLLYLASVAAEFLVRL